MQTAQRCKFYAPRSKIALLGTHAAAYHRQVLKTYPCVDYILRGEVETTALELANAHDINDIHGLSYRISQEVKINPKREPIENLDSLPFPDWDSFPLKSYKLPLTRRSYAMVLPTRGCPWSCSFCTAPQVYGHRLRKRSPQSIVQELQWLKTRHGIRDVLFWSDTFTADKDYVLDLCQQIAPLKMRWMANSRVDCVDPYLLKSMRSAGLWMLSFGIESGDAELLKQTGKGSTIVQSRSAVKMAQSVGLAVTTHFILGLPGENQETIRRTLQLAKELSPEVVQFYAATPFPGTRLHDPNLQTMTSEMEQATPQSSQKNLIQKAMLKGFCQYLFSRAPIRLLWKLFKQDYDVSFQLKEIWALLRARIRYLR